MFCQSRLKAAVCAAALVASAVHEVSAAGSAVPCPFEGPELLEQLQQGRSILSAEPELDVEPAFSLDGATPIPFAWGTEEITNPAEDSFKYEAEINELLTDPLSDWAQLPERSSDSFDTFASDTRTITHNPLMNPPFIYIQGNHQIYCMSDMHCKDLTMSNGSFILAARPIEVAGRPPVQIVGYFEAEFKTPGARGFFDWLVTPEGQESLTDTFAAVDGTLTRAFGPKDVGPNGAQVITTAEPTNLPSGITPVALVSTHWQTCGPNEMTYMAYPADVPLEQRLPEVAALDGMENVIEYSIVFAERVRQIDPETIKFSSIQWLTLSPAYPDPGSWEIFLRYYGGLHERLVEHFETTTYPPDSGDECEAEETSDYGAGGAYGE